MRDLAFRPQDLGIGHLFERVRDAVIVADAQTGRIVLWNPAATEIFGYSVSEALELRVEELVPERLRERHRVGLARYRETGRGPYVDSRELLELPAMRNTGEEIRIEMSLSPIEPTREIGDEERRYALAVVRDITVRKSTEEALRESEARFHALVENALDIVMVTDDQGTIRYVSPSIEWVLGYRSEEMVGTSTAEYVHPDDLERALGELAEALSRPGVHPVAVETRVRHKDGSWRHLEGIANNLLDDPAVGGIVFNHRDVTERKQAEEEVRRLNWELETRVKERTARLEATLAELRASEERHRQLVDNVEDYAIFMIDHDGGVADWNVGAERIFGYREEEIVGEPVSILFTPEDIRSGVPKRELRKAEEEGRAVDERWHVRKDGSRFWASGFVRPIRDDAGNLRGFAKVARDITERKKAEEALSQSEERYRAVVKQSTDGIYLVDGNTKRILETNPALQNMLGYTAQELNGMMLHEIVAHDRKDVEANIERTLREGWRFIRERRYRRKDGSEVDVEVAASTIHYGGKQVICAAIRDITERKKVEEEIRLLNEQLEARVRQRTAQLEDTNKELESFSYSVSHDLRAPIRHIGGFGRLLQSRSESSLDETSLRYLNTILSSADRAGILIDDLLSFSRMGRAEMSPAVVDMGRLVRETFADLRFETTGRDIHWDIGELPEVRGDRAMLQLVLQNLLSNAIKYTRPRAQAIIEVGSAPNDEEITFFVRDNGVGFNMAYADKLFDVFQRLHHAEEFEGTGIGLATVRRIVQRHGGRVWAEGRAGEGATFYFSLPPITRGNDGETR